MSFLLHSADICTPPTVSRETLQEEHVTLEVARVAHKARSDTILYARATNNKIGWLQDT